MRKPIFLWLGALGVVVAVGGIGFHQARRHHRLHEALPPSPLPTPAQARQGLTRASDVLARQHAPEIDPRRRAQAESALDAGLKPSDPASKDAPGQEAARREVVASGVSALPGIGKRLKDARDEKEVVAVLDLAAKIHGRATLDLLTEERAWAVNRGPAARAAWIRAMGSAGGREAILPLLSVLHEEGSRLGKEGWEAFDEVILAVARKDDAKAFAEAAQGFPEGEAQAQLITLSKELASEKTGLESLPPNAPVAVVANRLERETGLGDAVLLMRRLQALDTPEAALFLGHYVRERLHIGTQAARDQGINALSVICRMNSTASREALYGLFDGMKAPDRSLTLALLVDEGQAQDLPFLDQTGTRYPGLKSACDTAAEGIRRRQAVSTASKP